MSENKNIELTEDQKKALAQFGLNTPEAPLSNDPSEEEKKALLEAEAKKAADEAKAKEEADKKNTQPVEITDDLILNHLRAKGIDIKDLSDLAPKKSDEDAKKEAEKREVEKLSFGLKKGLFNRSQYESFVSDRKDKMGLVYQVELDEAKKEDSDWNEDKELEFRQDFESRFGINDDPDSSSYKRGQKRLSVLHESLLKSTYSSIYGLDAEYSKHEQSIREQKERQDKIIQGAPIYKQDVTDVVKGLEKVKVPLGKDEFEVSVSPDILQKVSEYLLDEEFVSRQILKGHKKENLQAVAVNLLKAEYFNELAFAAANLYRMKHEKGSRGIPEGGKVDNGTTGLEGLTEDQQKAISFFKLEPSLKAN
jgi:hypothetical protein